MTLYLMLPQVHLPRADSAVMVCRDGCNVVLCTNYFAGDDDDDNDAKKLDLGASAWEDLSGLP
jgi:hypothetical protein